VGDRGEGINHFYLSRDIGCSVWTTVKAEEQPRGRFSDHAIVYADLWI
jgi:hypothetical protein